MGVAINRVVLTGHLTRDPELREAGSTSVCSLRVAINERRKKGDEWVDAPVFVDVDVWGAQGENAAQYLAKGRQVAIDGKLAFDEWTNNDGDKRSKLYVTATNVQFVGSRDGDGGSGGGSRQTAGAGAGGGADAPY